MNNTFFSSFEKLIKEMYRLVAMVAIVVTSSLFIPQILEAQCPPNTVGCTNWQGGTGSVWVDVDPSATVKLCAFDVFYCTRQCGTSMEVILTKYEIHDVSCVLGTDLSYFEIMDKLRSALVNRALADWYILNPTGYVPYCNMNTHTYLDINVGFASCYTLSSDGNAITAQACDLSEVACKCQYKICRDNQLNIQVTLIGCTTPSTPCSEVIPDWTVTSGSFLRPCMRYCNP